MAKVRALTSNVPLSVGKREAVLNEITGSTLMSLGAKDETFLPDSFEVRGELVMSKDQFAALNASQRMEGEREYSNPRNLVAGLLNRFSLHPPPLLDS